MSDLEQYRRKNNVFITGLHDNKPHSCSRPLTDEKLSNSLEQQVASFLLSKRIEVDRNPIKVCHLLPRRSSNDKPAIIMRFVNKKHKTELLKQGKKLKGLDVYINEHLTKRSADISRKAQKHRKSRATWTSSYKTFISSGGW